MTTKDLPTEHTIDLTPDYGNLFRQFVRSIQPEVRGLLASGLTTEQVRQLNGVLYCIANAANSMTSGEALNSFRETLNTELARVNDEFRRRDYEDIGNLPDEA